MTDRRRMLVIAIVALAVLLAGGCGVVAVTNPEILGFSGGGERGSGGAGGPGGAPGEEDGDGASGGEGAAEDETGETGGQQPLPAARLDGVWRLTYRRISFTGIVSAPASYQQTWVFRPRCPSGACGVAAIQRLTRGRASVRLALRGEVYRGSATGRSDCLDPDTGAVTEVEGGRVREAATFRVVAASEQDGAWRATRITGRSAFRLSGCSAAGGSASYRVDGRRVS